MLSSEPQSSATHAFLLVLTSIEPESRLSADHPQVHRSGIAERHDLTVECFTDTGNHLKADVLIAALDAVDGALAGAERFGKLTLRPAPVLTGVTYELADACEVVV